MLQLTWLFGECPQCQTHEPLPWIPPSSPPGSRRACQRCSPLKIGWQRKLVAWLHHITPTRRSVVMMGNCRSQQRWLVLQQSLLREQHMATSRPTPRREPWRHADASSRAANTPEQGEQSIGRPSHGPGLRSSGGAAPSSKALSGVSLVTEMARLVGEGFRPPDVILTTPWLLPRSCAYIIIHMKTVTIGGVEYVKGMWKEVERWPCVEQGVNRYLPRCQIAQNVCTDARKWSIILGCMLFTTFHAK